MNSTQSLDFEFVSGVHTDAGKGRKERTLIQDETKGPNINKMWMQGYGSTPNLQMNGQRLGAGAPAPVAMPMSNKLFVLDYDIDKEKQKSTQFSLPQCSPKFSEGLGFGYKNSANNNENVSNTTLHNVNGISSTAPINVNSTMSSGAEKSQPVAGRDDNTSSSSLANVDGTGSTMDVANAARPKAKVQSLVQGDEKK